MKLAHLIAQGQSAIALMVFLSLQLAMGRSATANTILTAPSEKIAAQDPPVAGICPAQLPAAINAIANRPQFARSRWGILVTPLNSSTPLYSRDANSYFIPASNNKLLTTAAALHKLGGQFRIRTAVYRQGKDGLRLVGKGDPSLTDTQLQALAAQLKNQGINQVSQLIVEDGYFQGKVINSSWEWEDLQTDYAVPVNSLILNQNATQLILKPQKLGQPLQTIWQEETNQWQIENQAVTVAAEKPAQIAVVGVLGKPILQIQGQLPVDLAPISIGVAIFDPGRYFLQHFQTALTAQGITVAQSRVADMANRSTLEPELASVNSPPLAELVAETNQNSNNLYAEALLRSLGATSNTEGDTDSLGLIAVKQTLTALGVNPASYFQADGSGLSRRNLVSPEALVQTLQGMAQTPEASIFRASLPVAGVSGTLKNRFRDTPVQGNLQAKTGTLTGVSTLSGYLTPPSYPPLVISIMLNQSEQPARIIRQNIDEMVVLLARLQPCSGNSVNLNKALAK
jgi:D-alanyl-D-alanine carboxypeptidase/D-alanyl-D-alanine-endopeptidase (penicillin-binding protein 4)